MDFVDKSLYPQPSNLPKMSKTTHTDVSLPPQVLQLLKISKFVCLPLCLNLMPAFAD